MIRFLEEDGQRFGHQGRQADGVAAYRKALDIATAPPAEGASAKTIKTPGAVGAYYNNLAEALGNLDDGDAPQDFARVAALVGGVAPTSTSAPPRAPRHPCSLG